MNANQLFNMFARMLSRRLMNWGVNKGVGRLSKTGGKLTPGQARATREAVKRARQAARLTRRIGR